MSDDVLALLLAFAIFLLMAVWVPFLGFLQYIAQRDANRARDSAQVWREDSVRPLKHQDLVKQEFGTRKVHPEECTPATRIGIDECAGLSHLPRLEPQKSAADRIARRC